MKEIIFKRQAELEEIFASAHIEFDSEAAREKILELIDSGNVELTALLVDMDNQILKAKEEAVARKDILDKVEKWMSACEEKCWIEDCNRDDDMYNASLGAHLCFKRFEKSSGLVDEIPDLMFSLFAKIRAWKEDHGVPFKYDGYTLRAILEEYEYIILGPEIKASRIKRTMEQHKLQDMMRCFEKWCQPRCLGNPKKTLMQTHLLHDNQIHVLTLEDFISASPHLNKGTKVSTNKREVSRIVAIFPSPDDHHEEEVSANSGENFHAENETDQAFELVGGDDGMVDGMIRELPPKRVRFTLPALGDIILVDTRVGNSNKTISKREHTIFMSSLAN